MNASLAAALLLALLAGGLLLGRRRRRPLLRSIDASAVAALNRAQIERLLDGSLPPSHPSAVAPPADLPSGTMVASVPPDPRLERRVPRLLRRWSLLSREQRLQVLQQARLRPRVRLLPLLRRALRDADPLVVAAAAAALERYRGRPWPGEDQARGPAKPQ